MELRPIPDEHGIDDNAYSRHNTPNAGYDPPNLWVNLRSGDLSTQG